MANKTVSIRDNDGTIINVLYIDNGDGTYSQAVSGQGSSSPTAAAIATALGAQAEDAALSGGHTGIPLLTQRKDTAAASASTDGDAQDLITDAFGRLHTTNASIDTTNGLTKTGNKCAQGTLSGAADAILYTGDGVLWGVDVVNNSGSATTFQLYGNTTAAVPKIGPLYPIAAGAIVQLRWEKGVPFTGGVFIDYTLATSMDAQAYIGPVIV